MKSRQLPHALTPRREWWILDTLEAGRTAMPGRVLAYQGAEVCRGLRMKVIEVRPARPLDVADALAIKHSRDEIMQAQLNLAHAVGQLARGEHHGQT